MIKPKIPYDFFVKQAILTRRNNLEILRKDTLTKIQEALDALNRNIQFNEAYIFGSVTNPFHFNEDSDIDIGFYGLKDENFFHTISFLSEFIGRDVDIIQIENFSHLVKKIKEGIKWTKKN